MMRSSLVAAGLVATFTVSSMALAQTEQAPAKPTPAGAAAPTQPAEEKPKTKTTDGWTVLFDGTNLDNFRGYKKDSVPAGWELVDGTLHIKAKSGAGDLITKGQYENFMLEFEWKVSTGGNSGVMYRVKETDGAPYLTGPEYQVLDNAVHNDGKNPKTSAASLYALYACTVDATKPAGEWNLARILIVNNKVEHWLNGKKVVSTEIGGEEWNKLVAESKFKDWKEFGIHPKGHICFQEHGDDVWFRNIRINDIDAKKGEKKAKPAEGAPSSQ